MKRGFKKKRMRETSSWRDWRSFVAGFYLNPPSPSFVLIFCCGMQPSDTSAQPHTPIKTGQTELHLIKLAYPCKQLYIQRNVELVITWKRDIQKGCCQLSCIVVDWKLLLHSGGMPERLKEFDLALMLQYPVAMEIVALASAAIFTDLKLCADANFCDSIWLTLSDCD